MFVLALTGGLGSGKSTAAEVLAQRGAVVIDTDTIARHLLDDLDSLKRRVVAEFGESVMRADGTIDRAALADAAFATEHGIHALEALVHPAVHAVVVGALDALAAQVQPPLAVVLVIPLLAETPAFLELVDAVLAISAPEDVRVARAIKRGVSAEDVRRRIARQAGDGERREIADYVIENDGDVDAFKAAVDGFWDAEVAHREL